MAGQRQRLGLPKLAPKVKNYQGTPVPRAPNLPTPHAPSILRRGPKVLQGALLSNAKLETAIPPPESFLGTAYDGQSLQEVLRLGSAPEWACFWGLIKNGLMPDTYDGFSYQNAQAGGRTALGGVVLDFWIPTIAIGIDVQGIYYHYDRGTSVIAKDLSQKILLSSRGVNLIAVDADRVLADPIGVVRDALAGIDESRLVRGF